MAYGFFKIIKGLVIREEGTNTPKGIDIVPGGTASTKTTITSSQTTNQTITLPDATDTLVGKVTTDTLQNKTLNTTNDINVKSQAHFIISDETDTTKQVQFNLASVGTGSTQTLSVNGGGTIATSTNTVTLSNKNIDADLNTITNIENADIKAAAAIAYSKLNLTGAILNADLATGIDATKIANGTVSNTEFQFLDGVTSSIQTQLNSTVTSSSTNTFTNKTFDADGTGNSITNIENADIKAGAAIDATKIADGSVTSAEFQFINTLSSNAQTQLDAKQLRSVLTTKGDLYVATASDTTTRQAVGTDYNVLSGLSAATNGIGYLNQSGAYDLRNIGIDATASGTTLTIDILTAGLATPTTTNPILVNFRTTINTGSVIRTAITSALSMVISSGSTLGQVSGQPSYIWVYLLYNNGTPEIAVSHTKFAEDTLVTTVAEGGAGAADSPTTMYSTTARTNQSFRLVGYIVNTQATAGTWNTFPSKYQIAPFNTQNGISAQVFSSGSGTYITPAGCVRLRVRMVGGGGGGGGSGTANGTIGGTGGSTTFGGYTCVGGAGAQRVGTVGGGGSAGGTGGLNVIAVAGANGRPGSINPTTANGTQLQGGDGGGNALGQGGANGGPGGGGNGTNTPGTGGGGAGTDNTSAQQSGGGGGAGGYVEIIYNNPDASYSYGVGAAGAGGGLGTTGRIGGAGGAGVIYVEEFYY